MLIYGVKNADLLSVHKKCTVKNSWNPFERDGVKHNQTIAAVNKLVYHQHQGRALVDDTGITTEAFVPPPGNESMISFPPIGFRRSLIFNNPRL